jgi:hypothetical protein
LHYDASIVNFRIPIGLKAFQHWIHHPQDFMARCNHCAPVPPTYHKPLIVAFKLTLGLAGRIGDLTKESANRMISLANATSFLFSCAFIIARTHPGPGCLFSTVAKTLLLYSNFHNHHGGTDRIHPGNSLQDLPLSFIRAHRGKEVLIQVGNFRWDSAMAFT